MAHNFQRRSLTAIRYAARAVRWSRFLVFKESIVDVVG